MILERLAPVIVPIILLFAIAVFFLGMAIQTLRAPKHIYENCRRRYTAIKSANSGHASEQQKALLDQAERTGLVTVGMSSNSEGLVLLSYMPSQMDIETLLSSR